MKTIDTELFEERIGNRETEENIDDSDAKHIFITYASFL